MKKIRKIYCISIVVFFGIMLILSIFVWYQRAINTPVVDYVYIHQGTIKNQEQVENEGTKYKSCISGNALHQDGRGYFVYVVEERQGVLGNTYVAIKRRIDLIEMDDNLAAVEGNLTSIDKVIYYSDKELYDGCAILLEDF